MRLKGYMRLDEGFVGDMFKKLVRMPANSVMKKIKQEYKNFFGLVQKLDDKQLDEILGLLNKSMGTNYKNLQDLKRASSKIVESEQMNEDFKHWWAVIKDQGWFNITFFPALQVWFEIANMLGNFFKNEPIDMVSVKKAAFYGVLWLALASGKFIKDFYKWKKEHPEEYAKERGKEAKPTQVNQYT